MSHTFLVRPSNTEKEAFRAKLTAVSLLSLKLKPGDLCSIAREVVDNGQQQVQLQEEDDDDGGRRQQRQRYAIAWESSGNGMKDNIVQTSKFLQELHGLKLGDRIVIQRAQESLQDAGVVLLRSKGGAAALDDQQRKFWEYFAKLTVKSSYECLAETQKLSFKVGPELQEFEVADPGAGGMSIGRVTDQTTFSISDAGSTVSVDGVEFKPTALGGLDSQIAEVQRIVDRLLRPRISPKYAPVQGILLYGAKGVGKSSFIEELSKAGWKSVIRWQPGTKLGSLTSSTLVIIDQLDLPPAHNGSKPAIREVDRLFTAIKGKPCMIIGETRHPNDVDSYLRTEGKFSMELEIPIPSALQRKQIVTALRGEETTPDDEVLGQMAERTHGYVGADLHALLRRTLELASERSVAETGSEPDPPTAQTGSETSGTGVATTVPIGSPPPAWTVTPTDLSQALTQIRPSALQEIFLETPSTRWSDIGGQHANKQLLSNAVTRPLQLADRMAKLNLRPKKGVLLYGPPGCSKTLLVRALAREAGLNFLAVKGAELISMYVGESERATREVFRKARAASPSIIFFDEIDAIASRASGSTGSSATSSSSNLNVLTTLLNEMDGFEDLRNVFVVAATNRPETVDPALLRPGRFDNVVYIAPPDLEARKEIFSTQFVRGAYHSTARGVDDDVWYFAERTAGFSGAEIVGICQQAAELALDSERDYYKFLDVEEAVKGAVRGITQEMLEGFEAWNATRMR